MLRGTGGVWLVVMMLMMKAMRRERERRGEGGEKNGSWVPDKNVWLYNKVYYPPPVDKMSWKSTSAHSSCRERESSGCVWMGERRERGERERGT